MSSRSKSPEKRRPLHTRNPSSLDQVRNSIDNASRRLERGNPQTPPAQRFAPSTYSSPGSILGREEDAIVIELDPRYLTAGIEGESHPQCSIAFTPDRDRRIGDYRAWLPGWNKRQESFDNWGHEYELWRNDTNDLDLELLGYKLERSMREVYNKYLLVDAGLARLVLIMPSLVPHPVLEVMLSTLFERWSYPSITLLPRPTMAAFSAGLRSALVVDIGWEEVVVTSIYEYREIQTHRSRRAMKMLLRKVGMNLKKVMDDFPDSNLRSDLDFIETCLKRTVPLLNFTRPDIVSNQAGELSGSSDQNEATKIHTSEAQIEWPSEHSTKMITVPYRYISSAVHETFLADSDDGYADDEEKTLPNLIYEALLALSNDTRAVCISRLVFVGELSDNKSLKGRILDDVKHIIKSRGWSAVKHRNVQRQLTSSSEPLQEPSVLSDAKHDTPSDIGKDYVEERVRKLKLKRGQPTVVHSEVREVIPLGTWTGGSLLTSLKIRGFVEIEQEAFLSHGIVGAGRNINISVMAQPQRMSSFGIPKSTKTQDRTSWTLAGWG